MGKRIPIEDRFWTKVKEAPALECWEWTAARSHGYGVFSVDRKRKQAHRVAYELMVGPIPPLLVLDHLCKNTACVNPYHLDPVPLAVNSARSDAGEVNRARILANPRCIRGHDLNDPDVAFVNERGHRKCRPCKRIWYAARAGRLPRRKVGASLKFTVDDVHLIDAYRGAGMTWTSVAKLMGADMTTVFNAGHRKGGYANFPRESSSA